MISINKALPSHDQLPAIPPPLKYQSQRSVELKCITGEDVGTTCEYKQSSKGAMKLFGWLIAELEAQLDEGDGANIVPIVKLSSAQYKHKKYGKMTNPVWPVQEWRTLDNAGDPPSKAKVAAPVDDDDDDDDDAVAEEYNAVVDDIDTPRRRARRS